MLLVHPGGPFWSKRDHGAWSIPKGEFDESEEGLSAARREFEEELGFPPPSVPLDPLSVIRYSSGKYIHCWIGEATVDVSEVRSNQFEMEWPPRSGQIKRFPEVDDAAWFPLDIAADKILKGQRPLLDQLNAILRDSSQG